MKITSHNFVNGKAIPADFAFCAPDPETHAVSGGNRNPQIAWEDVPPEAKSLVLLCVDSDVPTSADDVNQEGRQVPKELPRQNFFHWVMVDIPPDCPGIDSGACSEGVTPRGKKDPPGPEGSRQGLNDYTAWFKGDANMEGEYFGYDGPCPPWNDSIVHHYHFRLYALDVKRCDVEGAFTGEDVLEAAGDHIVAQAEITATYSLNPNALTE